MTNYADPNHSGHAPKHVFETYSTDDDAQVTGKTRPANASERTFRSASGLKRIKYLFESISLILGLDDNSGVIDMKGVE